MGMFLYRRLTGVFAAMYTIAATALTVLLFFYGVLPIWLRLPIVIILLAIAVGMIYSTIRTRSAVRLTVNIFLTLLLSAAIGVVLYFGARGLSFWGGIYKTGHALAKEKPVDTNSESFNIYLAGVDNDGNIREKSRCDVNILLTVNPKTKKILMTTTPRDAYVGIGGDLQKMDKLTHAGVYGMDGSIGALEQLYGIPIHYFVKVNFKSFQDLVDAVGGVDIESDQAFSSRGAEFKKGMNHLNGEQALKFVRERYSLEGGDVARGGHQQAVLKGILNKLMSPKSFLHFDKIVKALRGNVATNLPSKGLMGLVNVSVFSGGGWTMERQIVTGEGHMDLPSYAMPTSQLYTMVLDPAQVDAAKAKIQQIFDAK